MPTVLKHRGYRFFFYSNEHSPVHIHVEKDDATAKFILEPIVLAQSNGFKSSELRLIHQIIEENVLEFINKWHEYFDSE